MKVKLVLIIWVFLMGFTIKGLFFSSVNTTIDDFFLPGSQPGQSGNLESPSKCDNCHGGYDSTVEPAFNWRGSMMSQAMRDPLFLATMTIANQDAPNSGDLCLRCHTPEGWLEGRSIPTDGSSLAASDYEGITCDFCHKIVEPTSLGVNPHPSDPDYTSGTYPNDQAYLAGLSVIPPASANGMYVTDSDNAKRGPFTDADGNHQELYSPYHSESAICGTCHDVSNPVFSAVTDGMGNIIDYEPNTMGAQAPDFNPHSMLPIERTYSEWKMSAYNTPTGVYSEVFGGNKDYVASCQDCHMQDVTGYGCNKNPPLRNDLPLHDMTGGNTFIPKTLYSLYDNDVDTTALNAGIERARFMLRNAAKLDINVNNEVVEVTVTNETGHKLPSGYPEGRRIWLHVEAWDSGGNYYTSGAYDTATAILNHDTDIKVYETKPGISPGLATALGLPSGPSFHFVLNDTIYKDNRIPPRGFTNANFEMIQSAPIGYSYPDGQYWDVTQYTLPFPPEAVRATLYYQTTSKEYIEFLRNENITDDWGQTMYDLWEEYGKSQPELMDSISWGVPIKDEDGDGYISLVDCNDLNAASYPGAPEIQDCLDNDCDGWTDEDFTSETEMVWTGCQETDDWNDPLNWNNNVVPASAHHVIIPSSTLGTFFPTVNGTVQVHSIKVEDGGYVMIAAGQSIELNNSTDPSIPALDIYGVVENQGTMRITHSMNDGIRINPLATFTVQGNVYIDSYSNIGLENWGILQLLNTGLLEITDQSDDAFMNHTGSELNIGGTVRIIK
jgi:hypothetical protein